MDRAGLRTTRRVRAVKGGLYRAEKIRLQTIVGSCSSFSFLTPPEEEGGRRRRKGMEANLDRFQRIHGLDEIKAETRRASKTSTSLMIASAHDVDTHRYVT